MGKVKCGNCGYALTIRRSNTKWGRYFVCSQSGTCGRCKGAGCTIYADVLEEYMLGTIKEKLSEFPKLSCVIDTGEAPQNIHKKIRLTQIEEEIQELLSKVSGANGVLLKYIDEKISELDTEQKTLQEEIITANVTDTASGVKPITNHIETWETISFEDKQAVVDTLIKVIRISDGNIKIIWNI